jgi:hypothetical protein
MEELCSLLQASPTKSGRFIDNLFDPVQLICWSADENQSHLFGAYISRVAFCVNFASGGTSVGITDMSKPINQHWYNIRAVRTGE